MPSRVLIAAAAVALFGLTGRGLAAGNEWAPSGATFVAMQTSPPPKPPSTPVPKVTAAERCTSLEQQFATAALIHFASSKLPAAKRLAEEGSEDCAKKKYALGTRRLVAALTELGVTPKL